MAAGDAQKFRPAVREICSRTDTQTDRQTDRNTPLPYRGPRRGKKK